MTSNFYPPPPVNLRRLLWFASDKDWAIEARLLRWLTFLWIFVGLAILFSASYAVADVETGDGLFYFKRQIGAIAIALIGFNIIVYSPLRYVLGIADWFVILLLGVIASTLLPGLGTTVNGATRWLAIGSFLVQPSELIKPFLVLQSARIFGQWERLKWSTRLIWISIFALTLAAILLQPNLSTAALCGMMIWLIALAAGLPWLYLSGAAGSGLMLAVISVSFKEYQRRRLMSFLNPWSDPAGDGYQLIQSLLAIGSGGFWGAGYGMSQQKLFYLPIQYTDFIFAVFAEEFGLVGSLLLLLLLGAYATVGLRVAIRAKNSVHQLVAIGVVVLLVGQSLLNIGVVTGTLPTTGLPFPLLSYGGNSVISSLLAAGILIRVARESSEAEVLSLDKRRSQRNRSSQSAFPTSVE
ncbi:FtsW/RodA/SpoVE family cell cycle protein [Microcoleus sp. FACHB-1515]|uniref:FtsW/RodA/SpoVE family cell cycle protein n=1 Tax=Microcoleus sp. FACHB-1515 TaxID=2692821 RepID=UPI0018EFE489|nr:FtsW/RodA/SpoVE family cell cycle protein [Microcoleus sp. FACHB-1515]